MKPNASISEEFYKIFEPVLSILRFSGFLPVACEQKGAKFIVQASLKWKIYSYILAIVLLVAAMMGLNEDLKSENSIRMKNPDVKYVMVVDLGEITITVFLGIVTAPFKLNFFRKILEKFQRIGKGLNKPYGVEDRKNTIFTIGIFLGIGTTILIYDGVVWGMNAPNIGTFLKRFGPTYICYFFIFVQEVPFCFFAKLVRVAIGGVNEVLDKGLEKKGQMGTWVSMSNISQHKTTKGLMFEKLNDLMRLVEDVDDVVEAINDFCGVHTLFILISCLLHLVVTPYFLLVEVCNEGYLPFVFLQLVWIFGHMGRLMVMVETCQSAIDEKTNTLVLKLLTSQLVPEVKEQVEVLTVQVSNKKIKFSAFGMMKISRSILTAFGGSVTTFLVILFQYGGARSNVYVKN